MNPEAMRKTLRLNVLMCFICLGQAVLDVVKRRIFEEGIIDFKAKTSLSLRFAAFVTIAFLLVPHEEIHGVSDRACFPRGHEAIGSKVADTFPDSVVVVALLQTAASRGGF